MLPGHWKCHPSFFFCLCRTLIFRGVFVLPHLLPSFHVSDSKTLQGVSRALDEALLSRLASRLRNFYHEGAHACTSSGQLEYQEGRKKAYTDHVLEEYCRLAGSSAPLWLVVLSLWTQHVRHVKNQKSLLTSGACWEAQEDALSLLKLLVSCLDASFESCRCPLCLDFSNINSNFKKSTQNENLNFDTKSWKKKGGIRNESRINAFCQSLERTVLTWAPGFCNLYKIGS